MNPDYEYRLKRMESDKKRYLKLIDTLRRRRINDLDRRFQKAHAEIFASVDCLACANCCRVLGPRINETDIRRISSFLGLSPAGFRKEFLKIDEDGDWIMNRLPCPFLEEDNTCSIYDKRPRACAGFPHTGERNAGGHLGETKKNLGICPALGPILDLVAAGLGYK